MQATDEGTCSRHAAVDLFKSRGAAVARERDASFLDRVITRLASSIVFNSDGNKHLQGSTSLAEEGKTPQSPTVWGRFAPPLCKKTNPSFRTTASPPFHLHRILLSSSSSFCSNWHSYFSLSFYLSLRSWMHYALLGSSTSVRRAQRSGTTLKTQKRKPSDRTFTVHLLRATALNATTKTHARNTRTRARAQVLGEPTHRIIAHVRETTVAAATTTQRRQRKGFTRLLAGNRARLHHMPKRSRSVRVLSPSSWHSAVPILPSMSTRRSPRFSSFVCLAVDDSDSTTATVRGPAVTNNDPAINRRHWQLAPPATPPTAPPCGRSANYGENRALDRSACVRIERRG